MGHALTRDAVVLYKRLVLGEPRRTLPTDMDKHGHEKVASIYSAGGKEGEEDGNAANA